MKSLCDQCKHFDRRTMRKLYAVYKDIGKPRPKHIWCSITDRPEDPRFEKCMNFSQFGGRK